MTYTPCDPFISLIVRAADGALSIEDSARLDAHIANCAGCREALADQRAVHLQLSSVEDALASPGFEAAVMDAVRAESPWTERFNWRAWTWRLAPVAAAAVLLAVGVAHAAMSAATSTTSRVGTAATTPALDLDELASGSGQPPVASALWSSSVSDASLLSLVLTAKADAPLSAYLKDK